jgi:hypothetical protein
MRKTGRIAMIMIAALLWTAGICIAAKVVTEGDRVYIVDRTGDRWDVTQSLELGFIPQEFQYGIGKNAFTPLQDEDFGDDLFGFSGVTGLPISGRFGQSGSMPYRKWLNAMFLQQKVLTTLVRCRLLVSSLNSL